MWGSQTCQQNGAIDHAEIERQRPPRHLNGLPAAGRSRAQLGGGILPTPPPPCHPGGTAGVIPPGRWDRCVCAQTQPACLQGPAVPVNTAESWGPRYMLRASPGQLGVSLRESV